LIVRVTKAGDMLTVSSVHDGWGLSDNEKGNAIFHGETEHMDAIRDKHNFVELEAHGLAVGLKEGLMGNSEVG
jgi:2,3-bisphosphoglycerate-independent phosphoglycerate mutase